MEELTIICPAKVDLFLNVTGKQDNYYQIKALMQSVDLNDYLIVSLNSTGQINIDCPDPECAKLIFKTALALKVYARIVFGFNIKVIKNIPKLWGLGSKETDAAGVFKAIVTLMHLKISDNDLATLAFQIDPSLPFFLVGGTCLIEGFGEKVTEVEFLESEFLIVKPKFTLSKNEALDFFDKYKHVYHDFKSLFIGQNDLEIVASREVQVIKDRLLEMGANNANMTGAGAVVGTFSNKKKKLQAYRALKEEFQTFQAQATKGIQIIKKTRLN